MSVPEVRMLIWMCGNTLKDRIQKINLQEVRVAPIEDKRETHLRWFGKKKTHRYNSEEK